MHCSLVRVRVIAVKQAKRDDYAARLILPYRRFNRGGKVCLAAFAHEEVPVDVAHIARNNIYVYGIRGEGKSATHRAEAFMQQKRFDATKIHTHTFPLDDLPTAIRYAKDRVDDAIKVVVKARMGAAQKEAAE